MIRQTAKNLALDVLTSAWGDSDGRVTLPVIAGPGRGLRFAFDLSRRIEAAYVTGRYDVAQVRTICQLATPGMVVWDVGTYLGFYSALVSRIVGPTGKVVAFEPDPENLSRAQHNARLNSLTNIQFVHAAIGEPVGEITLIKTANTNSHIDGAFVGRDRADYATRAPEHADTVTVPCMSLDQAYLDPTIPNPDIIKLDIEGAEQFALRHCDRLAREVGPVIMLELHNPECDSAAWDFAQETGYRLFSLETNQYFTSRSEVHGTVLCTREKVSG
jgi:FkbM family methyltransferase